MNRIYGPVVYRWCRSRGIDANDAADIMQDVLIAVAKSVNDFDLGRQNRSFRGWLYRITAFKIADYFRSRLGRPEVVAYSAIEETIAAGFEQPAKIVEMDADDKRLVVFRTIKSLKEEIPDIQWNAFYRTTVDGLKAPDVASELGITPASVRQIKFRVLKKLRDELRDLEDLGNIS